MCMDGPHTKKRVKERRGEGSDEGPHYGGMMTTNIFDSRDDDDHHNN